MACSIPTIASVRQWQTLALLSDATGATPNALRCSPVAILFHRELKRVQLRSLELDVHPDRLAG